MKAYFCLIALVSILLQKTVCSGTTVTWQLESYNDWNLPFAKTAEIQQRTGGDHYLNIATRSVKLEVDPSALFTIIFIENQSDFPDLQEEDLRSLNYTYFGNENMLDGYQGVWADITMVITATDSSSQQYSADITVFIAFGAAPDAGLDGTLGICITPAEEDWLQVSIMGQLEAKYGWPTIYVSYYFTQKGEYSLFDGFVQFSEEYEAAKDMTFGGQTIIQNQLYMNNDRTQEYSSLFDYPVVNPFLNLQLTQISFQNVLLQENQIFVTEFTNKINLTPASASTHLPDSIYEYMDDNFFTWLCTDVGENDNLADRTSTAVPLMNCQCSGKNYYGMPDVNFSLEVDQYETKYSYAMQPWEFMMSPKIDLDRRSEKCNLGFWNLESVDEDYQAQNVNAFAVGQNFIRKYNMTLKFVERQDSSDISLAMFIGNAQKNDGLFRSIIFALWTCLALLGYLGWFSVLRFRREAKDTIEFEKMKKGVNALNAEDARKIITSTRQEEEFLQGKADGTTINRLEQDRLLALGINPAETARRDPLPMRSSRTFVEKRHKAHLQVFEEDLSARLIDNK